MQLLVIAVAALSILTLGEARSWLGLALLGVGLIGVAGVVFAVCAVWDALPRQFQRTLRVTLGLATVAVCFLYATALFVLPLTLTWQQWREEVGLRVLIMWGLGAVFGCGGWYIIRTLLQGPPRYSSARSNASPTCSPPRRPGAGNRASLDAGARLANGALRPRGPDQGRTVLPFGPRKETMSGR
jgi:hypothetical protein